MPHPAVSLLADLVRCPSVTPEEEGVLDVLEAFLTPLGFACTRLRFEGDGSYPVGNLYATRKGAPGGPHLLFAGHTDVVPPGDTDAWTHDPFAADIAEGMLWGRGATDMKSGVAAFCAALAELAQSGALDSGTVSLAITNDEEADAINGTRKLLAWAQEQGERFDFSIVGEPSSAEKLGDSIKIGRRGSLTCRVTVTGMQGHVAYPDRALNPMPVLAEIATALNAPLDQGTEFFQASNLEITTIDTGNRATNVIPAGGSLTFNVRFNDSWTGETLRSEIDKRIASVDHRSCSVDITRVGLVSRCFISQPQGPVETLCRVIEDQTGARPQLSTAGGTSDGRFITDYCPVVECGLVGATMHQVDERVPIADVEGLTALYRDFVRAYFKEPAV